MARASDNKLAHASEVAKAMNDIMRFGFSCTLLLDVVMTYFLCILEDNREYLENSDLDSDDDSGPEMNWSSGPQTNASLPNLSCCRTSFNCILHNW